MSDKKQKRVERRAQREAYGRWKQHLPLIPEQYRLLGQLNRGRRSIKTLRGGATGLRQQDGRRVYGADFRKNRLLRNPVKKSENTLVCT